MGLVWLLKLLLKLHWESAPDPLKPHSSCQREAEISLFCETIQGLHTFLHHQEIPNCFLPHLVRNYCTRKIEYTQETDTQEVKQAFTAGHQQRFMYKKLIPVGFYQVTVQEQTSISNIPDYFFAYFLCSKGFSSTKEGYFQEAQIGSSLGTTQNRKSQSQRLPYLPISYCSYNLISDWEYWWTSAQ